MFVGIIFEQLSYVMAHWINTTMWSLPYIWYQIEGKLQTVVYLISNISSDLTGRENVLNMIKNMEIIL